MNRRHYLGVATATIAGLAGCMGDSEYTITDIGTSGMAGPLDYDIEAVDTAVTVDSPGSLDVTVRNGSETAVEISNIGVWPFGILALVPAKEHTFKTLLLTDGYDETDHVEVTANSTRTDNTRLVRSLAASESVTRRYFVHGNRLSGSGTYTLGDYFDGPLLSYRTDDTGSWIERNPTVSVTIAERSLLL
jgi:hypothetical protein